MRRNFIGKRYCTRVVYLLVVARETSVLSISTLLVQNTWDKWTDPLILAIKRLLRKEFRAGPPIIPYLGLQEHPIQLLRHKGKHRTYLPIRTCIVYEGDAVNLQSRRAIKSLLRLTSGITRSDSDFLLEFMMSTAQIKTWGMQIAMTATYDYHQQHLTKFWVDLILRVRTHIIICR